MNIGEKLRTLRYSKKLTLNQQSDIFDVSANSVYRWEHNLNSPRLPILRKIASYYNVQLEWLLNENTDEGVMEADLVQSESSEQQLLKIYRKLPANNKYKVLGYVERLYIETMGELGASAADELLERA